jgi:organic radical activating enzyme
MSANNDGSTKTCCMIKESYNKLIGPSKVNYNLLDLSIQKNFNNPKVIEIRNNLSQGIKDPACIRCWVEEDSERKSKRMRDNERYFHEVQWGQRQPFTGLAKFELNLGNTCNIKCRTCHASISSQWMKEDFDLNHSNHKTFQQYSSEMKRYHQSYDDESPFWEDLKNNLSTIKQFDFYGGEPFLSKKMWEILKICVEKGYSKDIELHYNTNGTTWPAEIELWKNFRSINLSFSIDGTDKQFEFMRFPANWQEVCKNMEKAVEFKKEYPFMNLSWCVTLSTLNIFYLPEILNEYYRSFLDFGLYLNLVHDPVHFNMSKIPNGIKDEIISKLETIDKSYTQAWYQLPGIIGFIKHGTPDMSNWSNFLKTVKIHDQYRKQNYFEIFPEFAEVIKKYE